MEENYMVGDRELHLNEQRLVERVEAEMGVIAYASLLTVLLDGAQEFLCISSGEVSVIRDWARYEGVTLPV